MTSTPTWEGGRERIPEGFLYFQPLLFRFTIAAKHHQTVAELFEDNVANMETVIQHYQIAADYFKGEECTSSANMCLVKVAQYTATMEKYEKAIQIYEQIATDCIQSNLLKYAAKDYFFKALLCHLCVGKYKYSSPVSTINYQLLSPLSSRQSERDPCPDQV